MKENFGIILDCWKVNIYIVLKKNSWRDKMLSKYGPIGRKFTPIHSHNLKKNKKKTKQHVTSTKFTTTYLDPFDILIYFKTVVNILLIV